MTSEVAGAAQREYTNQGTAYSHRRFIVIHFLESISSRAKFSKQFCRHELGHVQFKGKLDFLHSEEAFDVNASSNMAFKLARREETKLSDMSFKDTYVLTFNILARVPEAPGSVAGFH